MIRPFPIALCLALLCGAFGGGAAAQITVVAPTDTPALGNVVLASGTTTFSIAADGTVTRASGTGVRLSNASVTAPTINMTCGLLNLQALCAVRFVRVSVQPVAGAGPAGITQLRLANLTGAALYGAAPAPGSALTFTLWPMGLLTPVSFKLGMDVAVTAGAATGVQTYQYQVTTEFLP